MSVNNAIKTYGQNCAFITIEDNAGHLWVRIDGGKWVAFEARGHMVDDADISNLAVSAMRSHMDELMLAVDFDLCAIGA